MSAPRRPGETLEIRDPSQRALLRRFHDELYVPAFTADQREPLAVWEDRLWGPAPAPYELSIVLAGADLADAANARLDGGIVGERYPLSGCAILTYMVVAPAARRAGLGRALLDDARLRLGGRAHLVLGEVEDPAALAGDAAAVAAARLARFERWGARVVEHPYVQPCLAPGQARDRDLRLIAFLDRDPPPTIAGHTLRAFLREFYAVTEHARFGDGPDRDPELGPLLASIPDDVALRPPARAPGDQDPERRM